MSIFSRRASFLLDSTCVKIFSSSVSSIIPKRCLFSVRDIPRAPSYPFVGSLLHIFKRKPIYYHEYVDDLHKKLGPIFIDNIWGTELIHIADADANVKMYRHEGSEPLHGVPEMWKVHSEYRNNKRGLFFMDGKEWKEARTPTNSVVLQKTHLDEHVNNIFSITKEFIDTWKINPPTDLRYHLYCWNIECIGSTALGLRLGFLEKLRYFNKYDETHRYEDYFIKKSCSIFSTSADLLFKPTKLFKTLRLKSWRRYCIAADIELLSGEDYVMGALRECISENPSESIKGSLMYKLYQKGELDIHTIRRIFVEIFLASASSTSSAAVWVLYALGRNPDVAERVRQEISSVQAEELSLNTLNNKLPYLTGVIRETLRMYPTTAFITRILAIDADLCGYHIPAGSVVMASMYTMGRNPDYFLNPDSFMPERWQLGRKMKVVKPGTKMISNMRAYTPFAIGGRNCPGRNIAIMDMQILVIEALKAFEWSTKEVGLIFNLVGMPSKKVNLILKPFSKIK